jgi:hypothetical protein
MGIGQVALVCCAVSIGLWAERARACEPIACSVGSVFPSGGEIPVDQFRLTFRAAQDQRESSGARSLATPHLFRLDGTARTELALQSAPVDDDPFSFVLTPTAALAPGDRLVFEADQSPCSADILSATFTLTPVAPAPAMLGVLNVKLARQWLEIATSAGTCTTDVDAASADLSVSLSAAAEPFKDVVSYQLVLDDQPDVGASVGLDRGAARVYAPCGSDPGLADSTSTGPHRAFMRATMGDGTRVATAEVAFTLDCSGAAPASSTGVDAGALQTNPSSGCDVAGIRSRTPTWQTGSLALLALLCASRRRQRRPEARVIRPSHNLLKRSSRS